MKKLFLFMAILGVVMATVTTTFGYDLTDRDYDLLDVVEDRIFDIVEETDGLEIENIITLVERIQAKRDLSSKGEAIMEVLLADLHWYAGYDDEYDYEMTEEDCYEDEYFDEEDQECYLSKDEDGDDDYEDDEYDYGYDEEYSEEEHGHDADSEDDEEMDAIYELTIDGLTLLEGEKNTDHITARNEFSSLFPQRRIDFINKVQFYDNDDSETAAYVERVKNDGSTWLIAFNMSEIEQGDNAELYVHEMGHIITLDETQIAASTPSDADDDLYERHEKKCTTHYVFEGCLASSSYFYAFVAKFWTEGMLDMVEDEKEVYKKYGDEFLTDYAATNPGEDIAETFAYFVTKPKNHDETGITGQKIDFFYAYPEFVTLRAYIRERLPR